MRHQFKLYLISALLVLMALPSRAQSGCPTVQPLSGFQDYTIDLSTGAPIGKPSYKLSDQVRIVFVNKNPFLEYDIKITSKELGEPALTAFTNLFPLLPEEKKPQTPADTTLANKTLLDTIAKNKAKNDPCWTAIDTANRALTTARTSLNTLNQFAAALQSKLSSLKDTFSTSQSIFESRATCERLQSTGSNLQQAVEAAKPAASLTAYQSAYDSLLSPDSTGTSQIEKLDDAIGAANLACSADKEGLAFVETIRFQKRTLFGDQKLQDLSKQRQLFETTVKDLLSKADEIKTILSQPSNFITYRFVGPFSTRSEATVSVRVKKPSDKSFPDPDITATLNFGGPPRFTLGLGAAFSSLHTREYSSVQGLPLDGSGNPVAGGTVTRVIGLTDNSNQRITPMIVLNTRLSDGFKFVSGIHFALGVSGKVDNKGTDVEYLTGISFGLAEDQAFITLGVYNGRVQRLQPGFHVGSELPKDVANPPVSKDRAWKPMIAVSFKVR
ncbi:MAG: hypothetical protein QOF89_4764 [Acidobacteriota bacterium]|jgi:hypothetical protein|nr:hypothetical protein [Acidobacteriota bacterium]